eukprot:COSAG02_NODE_35194_length_472_cov_0.831099_1_plen_48_part_01
MYRCTTCCSIHVPRVVYVTAPPFVKDDLQTPTSTTVEVEMVREMLVLA